MEEERKLIVLSSNHRVEKETDIFIELFKEGMYQLHLRKHGFPEEKVEKIIKLIPQQYHKQIILHSQYSLVRKYNLGGIHISRKRRKDRLFNLWNLRKYKGKYLISTSYHSTRKIEKSPDYYDYFFLNSLFGSIKSQGKHSYKDKDKLEFFLRSTDKKVIALGGIDTVNIQDVKNIGFEYIGVHGALWGFDNPVERFIELRNALK